jgi:hypothetical protein
MARSTVLEFLPNALVKYIGGGEHLGDLVAGATQLVIVRKIGIIG